MDALPPNRLGEGERSVIAYAKSHEGYWAGLDNLQARTLAEALGLKVVGVIGVLFQGEGSGSSSDGTTTTGCLAAGGFSYDRGFVPGLFAVGG